MIRAALPLFLPVALACCSPEAVVASGEKAAKAVATAAGAEVEKAGEAAKNKAAALIADLPGTGELSKRAITWLTSDQVADGTTALVAKGVQLAPVALEVGKTLSSAVDSDTAIEPIVQRVDDQASKAKLDAAVAGMPRVEAIDGLQVGFRELHSLDSGTKHDESAWLVLWRQDAYLLGFIYRTRRDVDLDALVKEAPRLIGLVRSAL